MKLGALADAHGYPVHLPFQPHDLASHQARWQAVSERVFTVRERAGWRDGLAAPATNVFDFEAGLRLIITTNADGRGQLYLEASASFGGALRDAAMEVARTYGIGLATKRYHSLGLGSAAAITGMPTRRWRLGFVSAAGTPHWFAAVLS